MIMYGIPNCDTVKKVKTILEDNQIEYNFINFKKEAPTKKLIKATEKFLGELPVNKRGTTYRKIKEEFESSNKSEQISLLLSEPSAIKRPIIMKGEKVIAVGKTGVFFDQF